MARLLFIENRTTTFLWRAVARQLQSDGHEVHVLVFNRFYAEDGWGDIIIPFPSKGDLSSDIPDDLVKTFTRIASSDRNLRHYAGNRSHYCFYYFKIRHAIENYRPHIIFGEATTFYELMCSEICKGLGILYLSPLTCRYPPGRFSFFQYDTLEAFDTGVSHCLSRQECLDLIESISNRTVVTDDVRSTSFISRLLLLPRKIRDKILLLRAYIEGERFCTPSPIRRCILSLGVVIKKTLWDIAVTLKRLPDISENNRANCLYAMQMQPEAAIDVYGTEWNDQVALVAKLSQICVEQGFRLLLKANPKFKLEVTFDLITLAIKRQNVYLLPRKMTMKAALAGSGVVIGVAGTVLLECVLSGKPAIALTNHPFTRQRGCVFAAEENQISTALERVARGQVETSTLEERVEHLTRITRNTFRGLISEPLGDPACVTRENILNLGEAFRNVIRAGKTTRGHFLSYRSDTREVRSTNTAPVDNHA